MAPFWIVWPLRKAAAVPAVAIGAAALGAAVGSFDLTRSLTSMVVGRSRTSRRGTTFVATSAALGIGAGVVALREALFAPLVVPPPVLPIDGQVSMAMRIQNASIIAAHVVKHYPYRFRFTNAFVAGAAAAVAYVASEKLYNSGSTASSRPVPSSTPAAAAAAASPVDSSDADTRTTLFSEVVPSQEAPLKAASSSPASLDPATTEILAELDGVGTVVKYSDDPYER